MKSFNDAVLCPIEPFLEHYELSPVQDDDVTKCKNFLVTHSLLEEQPEKMFRWYNVVPDDDNCTNATGTYAVADDLKLIVNKIFEYATSKAKRSVALGYDLAQGKTSGTGHGHGTGPKAPFHFVITPRKTEYQSVAQFETEVSWQPFDECHNILSRDAHRMFVFAVTVDNSRMGLCYCSHSGFVKVPPFDWVQSENIDTFIRVFLGFACATPETLGFDTTITLASDNSLDKPRSSRNGQHYTYRCPVEEDLVAGCAMSKVPRFKYFKTVKAINDMHSYDSSGRKTRIWAVVEVTGPDTNETVTGERLILKDVWLDTSRKTEAENMDMIFEAVESLVAKSKETWGDDWQARLVAEDPRFIKLDTDTKNRFQHFLTDGNYKSLFLTKLYAWKGAVSRKLVLSQDFKPKQQTRIVYKEVCQDLDTVGTLGNFMDLINQALDALRIMFCAQWVHRDISLRNILAFKDDNGVWKVKLADLEFSQKHGSDVLRSDSCIGTPYYMPYEIMTGYYLVKHVMEETDPENSMSNYLGLDEGTPEYERYQTFTKFKTRAKGVPSTATAQIPKAETIVRYNYQHDLESIWWIVFHAITALVDYRISKDYCLKVFQSSRTPSHERGLAWLLKFTVQVKPVIYPALADPFSSLLEKLRSRMHEEYLTREMFGQLNVDESYAEIHQYFSLQLKNFLEKNEGNWKATPISPNGVFVHGIKRAVDHDEGNEQQATVTESAPRDTKRRRGAGVDAN